MAAENKAEPEEEDVVVPSFKLSYFPFAGRAASLRLAAFVGGLAYTDAFVTKEDHAATKKLGGRRWSGLPELAIYGKDNKEIVTMGQSNSILRYIGSLCDLYPSNPLLAALCDEVLDSVEDAKSALLGAMQSKQDRAKLISKDGALTYWLSKFEARLEENKKRGNEEGYIVANELTIADLKAFELFHSLLLIFESFDDIPGDFITHYPNIQKHYGLVMEMESVQDFLQKFSLRNSEFKMDPNDQDIKTQTYSGKFVCGSL